MEPIRTASQLGERIRDSRIAVSRSQAEVAEALAVDRSAIVRIEQGDRRVSATELFAIADFLDVPITAFVYEPATAIVSRRMPLDDEDDRVAKARYRSDALLDAALRDAEQLRDGGYLQPAKALRLPRVATAEDARTAALAFRKKLKLGQAALGSIHDVAERVGLYLRVVRGAGTEGASITPMPGFGVSVLAAESEPGRRRFTACHEIVHHVLGDEYSSDFSVASSRDERERVVDAFAAELLMPSDVVKSQLAQASGDSMRSAMIGLAGEYRVSWTAVLEIATRVGAITASQAGMLRPDVPRRGDFLAVRGSEPPEDLLKDSTGAKWKQAVMQAYLDQTIGRQRAVELTLGALSEAELPDFPADSEW